MRTLYSSGSAWESTMGYSRAVQVGDSLYISATSAAAPDGTVSGDLYEQTRFALEKLGPVLAEAGFHYEDVVQSKVYVTNIADWEQAAKAHGETFGDIRPALSLLHVLPFLDPAMLVEIELVAHRVSTTD
jgi:enamine deaminase RidA (YjgF/YER057c/UK114 family)